MVSRRAAWLFLSTVFLLVALYIRRNTTLPTWAYVGIYSLLTVGNLFTCWAFHAWVHPRFFSPLRTIPSPKGWNPWIGYAFQDLGKDKVQGSSQRTWVEELAGEDLIRVADLFQTQKIIPVSPRALTDILTTKCYDFEKPSAFRTGSLLAILGNGLLFAEGAAHKRQRKQLNPAFSYRNIKDLYPTFWCGSTELVWYLEAQVRKGEGVATIEPNDVSSRATLDILGEAGFGKSFNALHNPDNPTTKAYKALFSATSISDILFGIAEVLLPGWLVLAVPHPRNWRLHRNTRAVRDVCAGMIDTKRQTMEKQGGGPAGTDILSLVLSQKEVTFTDAEMVEQLATFLVAGHETTAAGMAWAVFVLCARPEVQQRLRDEVREHIPASAFDADKQSRVTPEQLDACTYLQAFCAEVLRVYAPVPVTIREAVVDTTVAGRPIPKGTGIVLSPWAVNIATSNWGPDAAEFRPERWLENPGSGGAKSIYANLTFIHGPRSCIGMGFAKAEFACLVAAWVARLESSFHKDEGWKEPKVTMLGGIAARPEAGWKVDVKVVEW